MTPFRGWHGDAREIFGSGLVFAAMPPLPTDRMILGLSGRALFGVLVLLAIAVFVYSMSRRIRVLMAGRGDNRFTRIGERIGKTLEYAFAQKRMFRDFYAGFFHILIFGGFVVLTVRTIALVVEGLVPGFRLLPGAAGNTYTLVKDIFEIIRRINRERGVTVLLVEQNANVALHTADYGYVLELGRIVMEDTCARLLDKDDIREFYLGLKESSVRGTRRWKRKKTWR